MSCQKQLKHPRLNKRFLKNRSLLLNVHSIPFREVIWIALSDDPSSIRSTRALTSSEREQGDSIWTIFAPCDPKELCDLPFSSIHRVAGRQETMEVKRGIKSYAPLMFSKQWSRWQSVSIKA